MANEAVIIELTGFDKGCPRTFTCASGTAIAKGALLQISGDNTVSLTGSASTFTGIAAAAKSGIDYSTTLAVYKHGIFDLYADGGDAITAGKMVSISGANTIKEAIDTDFEAGKVVGQALEGVGAGTAETIAVELL